MADTQTGQRSNAREGRRPVILVAARFEEGHAHKTEVLAPNECGARVFFDAILAAGGLPVQMSLTDDEVVIDQYVTLADGVAIPGGPDVDPKLWGDDAPYDESLLCHVRDACELPLVRKAIAADKPLFTTCRGTQMLNGRLAAPSTWTSRASRAVRGRWPMTTPICSRARAIAWRSSPAACSSVPRARTALP